MYFVMLQHPCADIPAVPLLKANAQDGGDIAFFDTDDDAFSAATKNDFGENFGFDVFELGNGVI